MFVRIAAAVCAVLCLASHPAPAQETPPVPPATRFYDWTGVYIGANAAYVSASITKPTTDAITGGLAGGQIGANYQFGQIVVGAEIDGDWSSIKGDFSIPWLATARLRIGAAYDRIQYFATGGAATLKYTPPSSLGLGAASSTQTAWVGGVGSESAVNRNVVLQFELLYLQLLGNSAPVTLSGRVYEIIGRVGLSYKFNWRD
jgi:outer membrane immunogenic protein